MMNTEKRIAGLERENKARKASYPVSGSLVPFVVQRSQVWTRAQGGNTNINVRIKFTPSNPGKTKMSLITLSPEVSLANNFSSRYSKQFYYNEPQTGDGSIVLNINIATPASVFTYYIRVTASGTSGGVFSLA